MKQRKQDKQLLYSKWESFTNDDLEKIANEKRKDLPQELQSTVHFELDSYGYDYDPTTYTGLFLKWYRYETDAEEFLREKQEADALLQRTERDKAEFERLSKMFSSTS